MNLKLPLLLKVDSEEKAEAILGLIFRVSSPLKIVISLEISKKVDADKILNILMRYYKKNISLELSCSKENMNSLFDFFKVVPMVFIDCIVGDVDEIKDAFAFMTSKCESNLIISHLIEVK